MTSAEPQYAAELLRETMAALGRGDARAAVDGVVSALGVLADGDAAGLGLRVGGCHVLASTWGACPLPCGLRASDLLTRLEGLAGTSCTWPVSTASGPVGWLWVGRRRGRRFSLREVELVHTLADLTALRFGRARGPAPDAGATRPVPAIRLAAPADAPSPVPAASPGAEPGRLVVPTFPPALARIVAATDDERGDLAALADAVTLDPLLPPHLLRAANAPALGRRRAVGSITEALGLLGMRGVRNLAVGQFARTLFARWEPVDQMLWEQALGTAAGTQMVLERAGHGGGEDGYLCGLLHNMATVALQSAEPERYRRVVGRVVAGTTDWDDAERAIFGQPALARLPELLDEWGLPAGIAQVLCACAQGRAHGPLGAALAWARWSGLRASGEWQRLLGGDPEPVWLSEAVARATPPGSAETLVALEAQIAERCRALRRLMD
ncbi:MAG: HDOD domain-containing protein [bacterium]|nr:HDOD domain-containing protein [bacterium]